MNNVNILQINIHYAEKVTEYTECTDSEEASDHETDH